MVERSHEAQVLIVDDDAPTSSVLADLLECQGYSVACSGNGKEALDYLRTGPPPTRLILLDLEMPVMDGWQFRREQLADNKLREIPLIVLSGHLGSVDIQADAILRKPVHLDRLLALLHLFLREART